MKYFNKGLHQHRFSQNPLEEKFAKAWEKLNPKGSNNNLEYILALNNNRPRGEVSDRDRQVAATIIQWLGSPVGRNFIKDVLTK